MKIKNISIPSVILAGLLFLAAGPRPAFAVTLKEAFSNAGRDVVANSKVTFLEQAEIGWGWNLRDDSHGSPMALLGLYRYRFVNLNAGWHDPFTSGRTGAPSLLVGIHLDGLARTIAPNSSDFITSIVPAAIRPVWNILTVSYGPGYDVDRGIWGHFLAVNFRFGGDAAPTGN